MNGVHDMGGMQGFGPVRPEENEPVFHAPWEGRAFAMAVSTWGQFNLGYSRFGIESLPPADYLAMSYYEKWITGLTNRMINAGVATRAEVENGHAALGSVKRIPPLTANGVVGFVQDGGSSTRDVVVRARFRASQRVRARNINPPTHTRLPHYARGKVGVILHDHGVFVFPDADAQGLGEKPQHLYSVRFAARELWGREAPARDWVNLDLWDDYLDRA